MDQDHHKTRWKSKRHRSREDSFHDQLYEVALKRMIPSRNENAKRVNSRDVRGAAELSTSVTSDIFGMRNSKPWPHGFSFLQLKAGAIEFFGKEAIFWLIKQVRPFC